MRTLKLTIAYDGTEFAGWQRQANERTVQAAIEDALQPDRGRARRHHRRRPHRRRRACRRSGRQRLAHVARSRPTTLLRALNATLPRDVRVIAVVEEAPAGFNARFDARRKTYRYCDLVRAASCRRTLRRFVWHVPQPLDVGRDGRSGRVAASAQHDFAAFQAAGE